MSSLQTQTTSFKAECWQAIHNLLTDTIKMALYTNAATLDETTAAYTTASEVTTPGYVAGGEVMTGASVDTFGFTAFASFANTTFPVPLTARYALIYNASKGNKSIAVLDFGTDKTSLTAFTVALPPNTATTALLRSSN